MTIHYEFPVINHISEVLEVIKDRPEFIVAVKDGYTVINYVVAGVDTFPPVTDWATAVLRECRGLVFDNETGAVIARRFHKFFNLGEREELLAGNFEMKTHKIPVKLDGSMITPIPLNGKIFWGTKMGITDVAASVQEFVNAHPEYEQFAIDETKCKYTPIFEWCSNKQRIVIDHPEDSLILLAIRDNVNGDYVPRALLETTTEYYGIPLVPLIEVGDNLTDEVHETIRAQEGAEGVVVTFDNGHMVKIKSDWYVRLHRTKDAISTERKVVDLMLNGNIDDLKPLMDKESFDKIISYEQSFCHAIGETIAGILATVDHLEAEGVDKKTFAIEYSKSSRVASLIFKWYDNKHVSFYDMIISRVKVACNNNKNFDAVKEMYFPDVIPYNGTIEE